MGFKLSDVKTNPVNNIYGFDFELCAETDGNPNQNVNPINIILLLFSNMVGFLCFEYTKKLV
jgi:hypothetical protein